MGFLKNYLKNRNDKKMAKRFRGGIKEDIVKEVEEIAERVAEEEVEEMKVEEEFVPEGKMRKEEFLISKGLHDRPNSHMAIKAWEDYQDSFYDI